MATANMLAFLLMFVGALVFVWGRRTSILTAGIGGLFGVGILSLLPGQQNGIFALLVVFGLATAGSIAGLFIKAWGNFWLTVYIQTPIFCQYRIRPSYQI